MLKLVTFDLGDTLIDYGPMHYGQMMRYGVTAAYEYLEHLGPVSPPPVRRFAARLSRAVRHTWYRSKFLIEDRNVEAALVRALARLGVRLPEAEQRELVRRFFTALSRLTRPMPGAEAVLAQLADRGLRLAVVSNTILPPWFMDESLEAVGLLRFFPARFYSCAVGAKKPERPIFAHVLESLSVRPADALHVGDRYLTDVWGARRSGLRTCLKVGHLSLPIPPVRPDYRIRRMDELVPIIDALLDRPDIMD